MEMNNNILYYLENIYSKEEIIFVEPHLQYITFFHIQIFQIVLHDKAILSVGWFVSGSKYTGEKIKRLFEQYIFYI